MKQEWLTLDISQLVKAPWNYKDQNDETQEKLVNAIKENGQIVNFIVRELPDGNYEVVNGNHRYDAMLELSLEDELYTQVFCVNLGPIDQAMAEKVAIETNELRFESNTDKLNRLLKRVNEKYSIQDMIKSMPFTQKDLKARLKSVAKIKEEVSFTSGKNKYKEPDAEQPEKNFTKCPHCKKSFEI